MKLNFIMFFSKLKVLVPYVVKNPLGNLEEPIKNQLFDAKVDEFIRKSANF